MLMHKGVWRRIIRWYGGHGDKHLSWRSIGSDWGVLAASLLAVLSIYLILYCASLVILEPLL